jgi:hypothetical protein
LAPGALRAQGASGGGGPDPGDDEQTRFYGTVQTEAAYTYADPDHWSKLRLRGLAGATGRISESLKWRVSARGWLDGAYGVEHGFYPADVRDHYRHEAEFGETYLDWTKGDWEFRFGRQQIVWGEMVSLFVADVVSARDLREFVLPEFEQIRIPQWAARAEWFGDDQHLELVWVVHPSFDEIGRPGGDFYPFPIATPGLGYAIDGEVIPSRKLSNTGYGARYSTLLDGWDLAAFFYRSLEVAPTFYRSIVPGSIPVPGGGFTGPGATAVYEARHERISQFGGTLSKDFSGVLLKAEAVYTDGRKYNTIRLDAPDGLVPSDTLEWIVGVDLTPADDWRVNAQVFQRIHFDHEDEMLIDRAETGGSVLVNRKFGGRWEVEALIAAGFNRSDWMFRPAVIWNGGRNWRIRAGVDVFGGEDIGFFGRFDAQDRIYAEFRYTF